jgi:hypothetical protein
MENISKMARTSLSVEEKKSKENIKILTKKNLNKSVEFGNPELAPPGPKGAVNNGTQPRSFAAIASGSNADKEQVTIVSVIDCEQSQGQINTVLVNDDDSNKGKSANDPESAMILLVRTMNVYGSYYVKNGSPDQSQKLPWHAFIYPHR